MVTGDGTVRMFMFTLDLDGDAGDTVQEVH